MNEDTAIFLIKTAICPQCNGSGMYFDVYKNACTCQWCYQKKLTIKKYEDKHGNK